MNRDSVRARAEGFIAGFSMRPAFELGEMETAWLEYVKNRGADPLKEPLFEDAFDVVAQQIKNSSMEEIDCDEGIFPVDLSKE